MLLRHIVSWRPFRHPIQCILIAAAAWKNIINPGATNAKAIPIKGNPACNLIVNVHNHNHNNYKPPRDCNKQKYPSFHPSRLGRTATLKFATVDGIEHKRTFYILKPSGMETLHSIINQLRRSFQVRWAPTSCTSSCQPRMNSQSYTNTPPICPFPLLLLSHPRSLQSRQIRGSSCVSALKFIPIHTHQIIQDEEREIDNQNKDTFSNFA